MSDDPVQAQVAGGDAPPKTPAIEEFLGEPTRDLVAWAGLWTADVEFPVQRTGGLKGRLSSFLKKLVRPLVKASLGDLWDRQRVFNLIVLETLIKQREDYSDRLDVHRDRLDILDARTTQGFQDVMAHNDALYARVDQKLDRYRRDAKNLWHRLGAMISAQEALTSSGASDPEPSPSSGVASPEKILEEQEYLALEQRFRGSEEDIGRRVEAYRPYLRGLDSVLDLGCGRGEALKLFSDLGMSARGVDSSAEMVARCREKGLTAEQGDLFEALAKCPEGELGAVVSFHVIEHLPAALVPRLVRLAWRALKPGGVLILETPSPLALAMSARDFWMDPTHGRPVHPAHLETTYREAGFEPVHRVDLHPFPDDSRLPEIDLGALPEDQRPLADQVNRMRDLLDDLLFGHRDFGMVGFKPPAP